MQLTSSFTIARPADEVYAAFLQVDRIATCMPGSTLLGQPEPDTYEGEVKVKVGPLSVIYAGQFVVVSADDKNRRLKMRAQGREKRGAGSAEAQIVARLVEADGQTTVRIDTDLDIRGKVAQFGRGVIGEVTDGIMQAFASNVEAMLARDALSDGGVSQVDAPAASNATPGDAASSGVATQESSSESASDSTSFAAPTVEADSLDAWSLIIRPLLRRNSANLALVALSGLAGWLGARAGVAPRRARRALRAAKPDV